MFTKSSCKATRADINRNDRLVHDSTVGPEETIDNLQYSVWDDYEKWKGCRANSFSLSYSFVSYLLDKYSRKEW